MTRRVAPEAILVVLPAWVAARVLVGVGWLVARLLAEGEEPHALSRGLLAWDGDWYQSLMLHGYEGCRWRGFGSFRGTSSSVA